MLGTAVAAGGEGHGGMAACHSASPRLGLHRRLSGFHVVEASCTGHDDRHQYLLDAGGGVARRHLRGPLGPSRTSRRSMRGRTGCGNRRLFGSTGCAHRCHVRKQCSRERARRARAWRDACGVLPGWLGAAAALPLGGSSLPEQGGRLPGSRARAGALLSGDPGSRSRRRARPHAACRRDSGVSRRCWSASGRTTGDRNWWTSPSSTRRVAFEVAARPFTSERCRLWLRRSSTIPPTR